MMRAIQFILPTAILSAATLLTAATASAHAATVSLGLISRQTAPGDPAGEWELWAWTSVGDNDGIATYAVDLAGDDVRGDHTSPLILIDHNMATSFGGFGLFRYPIPNPEDGDTLFAAQYYIASDSGILYGVGIPGLTGPLVPPRLYPPFDLDFTIDPEWWSNPGFDSSAAQAHPGSGDNPFQIPAGAVQLGEGTTSRFASLSLLPSTRVIVYDLGESNHNGMDAEFANITLLVDHVPAVPEPSSLLITIVTAGIAFVFTISRSFMADSDFKYGEFVI